MRRLSIALMFVMSVATSLHAQEGPASEATTSELIQQGIALRKAGKDEAALRLFLELEQDAPNSVRVLLQIAAAAQATGKWLMAYEYLQKAARFKRDPYYQRHASDIKQAEDAIARHVGQFRAVGAPAGAEVLLNGELVGTLPMEGARPFAVGSYLLEVRKPGFYSLRRPLAIAAGSTLTQEAVELHETLPSDATLPHSTTPSRPFVAAEAPPQLGWRSRWVTWSLAGAGGAALLTSGVALAVRQNKVDEWNDESVCLDPSDPNKTREELCGGKRSAANTAQTVAWVSGSLGIVLGVSALAHYLAVRSPSSTQTGSRTLCLPSLGGISCQGAF
ncbi:MAG: tetratricopeptide repeat protein [Polyangiaceae bacterium]